MKGQLDVKTPAEYLAVAVDDKRRSDVAALDALIRKNAPKLEPVIMGGLLGYGPFQYRYASGREGDACVLSIASNACTSRCTASPPTRRATSPSGTSTDSRRPASASPASASRSSRTSTQKALVARSSRRPRRWALCPEPALRATTIRGPTSCSNPPDGRHHADQVMYWNSYPLRRRLSGWRWAGAGRAGDRSDRRPAQRQTGSMSPGIQVWSNHGSSGP